MLNLYKSVCSFFTKMLDLVNSYMHHVEKKPRQEVGDGYNSVNYSEIRLELVIEVIFIDGKQNTLFLP